MTQTRITDVNSRGKNDPQKNVQSITGHLIELRRRLLLSLAAILVLFFPLYLFANDIYLFASKPLLQFLPEGSMMIATEVASPFLTPFKLSLVLAVFLAIPYILYQFWAFIAPGLYEHEKHLIIPIQVSSVILFYAGVCFSYLVVLPIIFQFTTSVVPDGVALMTDINRYLDFILKLFFAFGVAFEIPVATLVLVRAGATTTQSLKRKRPYIIVGCFLIGMLLTPPDVISQILLAIPMWLLFETGLWLSRWMKSRQPVQPPSAP